jgi:hypothetical protein
MDQITKSQLTEFATAHNVDDVAEDKQFEHFVSFITLRRHHTRTFDTDDIVIGGGGDTTIDSIAILVNGALVTDIDTIAELADRNGYLEPNLIFTQADRGEHFESAKMGEFGNGVEDFFKPVPALPRNQRVNDAAKIWKAIMDRANLIQKKPMCRLYYVTTGTWNDDAQLVARRNGIKAALEATQLFQEVEFLCYGANEIHRLYNQTKSAVTREFTFREKSEIPSPAGVIQAYLGYIPASEFLKIIRDDSGDDILGNIFDENVRDWQDYNSVNKEIKSTLASPTRGRFVLMNNGVTIITRELGTLGSNFTLKDFQIVNGCQTSHVVFDQRGEDLADVYVPLRLIHTTDDEVKKDIIQATNRQTELKPEQLYAMTDFANNLEMYFKSHEDDARKLYYERRDCQYDRFPEIEKTRIVAPQSLIRAFGAMFLDEPTKVTRNYKAIRELVGDKIFKEGDRLEPYYTAAFAAYRLEFLFRNRKLDSEYKAARYHVLTAFRYLVNADSMPHMNAHRMADRCKELLDILWDIEAASEKLTEAATIVREVVGKEFDRDNIRTEPVRDKLLAKFGVRRS